MERFCVLQVLYEQGDPVVVGELVEDVGDVEGGSLYEEEEGDPLVVGVVHGLLLVPVSGPHPRVDSSLPLGRQCEGVGDVAVGVEGGLAQEVVSRGVTGAVNVFPQQLLGEEEGGEEEEEQPGGQVDEDDRGGDDEGGGSEGGRPTHRSSDVPSPLAITVQNLRGHQIYS